MEGEKKPVVSNVGAWAMNIISSIRIIMANNQLMSSGGYGFTFAKMKEQMDQITELKIRDSGLSLENTSDTGGP